MNLDFLNDLNLAIEYNALIKDHTTFSLGGTCPCIITCSQAAVLQETVIRLRAHQIKFILMGFGSNILASDHGLDKVILRFTSDTPCIQRNNNLIMTDAATQLDTVVNYAIDQGLDGMTSLLGIPGTIGGAIAGNAGAYGRQISDHLSMLTVLRPDNSIVTLKKGSIPFTYRDSPFKHNNDIILNAVFDLTPCPDDELAEKRQQVLNERKFKLTFWQETPCAGSFFRNVEPTSKAERRQSAGYYLEQAGAKGLALNGARVYEQHANIITHDHATAQAVYDLTKKMAGLVRSKFGINLVREVRMLGKFENAPDCDPEGYW